VLVLSNATNNVVGNMENMTRNVMSAIGQMYNTTDRYILLRYSTSLTRTMNTQMWVQESITIKVYRFKYFYLKKNIDPARKLRNI
jgi:hypothetical protein